MSLAILILLVVDLVIVAAVVLFAVRIRRRTGELATALAGAANLAADQLDADSQAIAGRDRLITIEILNPIELAASQSKYSGLASSVAPDLIRRIVYQKVAEGLAEGLAEQGADAKVAIRVAR